MQMRSRSCQLLRISFVASICFLGGCQYDPWADGFLKGPAADKDLVGTYRVDSDTLTRHIPIGTTSSNLSISRAAEIVLSADHKVQFSHVPEVDDRTEKPCVISGVGTWELLNSNYTAVFVQIQRTDYPPSGDGCGPERNQELNLYGKKPPYKLHITIGDPDTGDALQFEKVR